MNNIRNDQLSIILSYYTTYDELFTVDSLCLLSLNKHWNKSLMSLKEDDKQYARLKKIMYINMPNRVNHL